MTKYDIVSIGDSFEDILVLPTDLKVKKDSSFASGFGVSFELGEKIPLEDVNYSIGGSACNTAVAFSRLGLNSSVISVVGDDMASEKIFSKLKEEDVDASNIIVDKKMKTNFSVIFRMEEGRSIFVYRGLKDYSVLNIKKNVRSKWFFLAPLGENTTNIENELVAQISENNAFLAWNPGALQIKKGASSFRNLLRNTAVLNLNREEAIKFMDYPVRPRIEETLKRLHELGPKIVVITNGKNGAKAYDGKTYYEITALPHVVRVDSTGAGDSFAAGFISKLILSDWNGMNEDRGLIDEALRWGIINSNSVITKIGAQKGLLTREELEKRVVSHYCLEIKSS